MKYGFLTKRFREIDSKTAAILEFFTEAGKIHEWTVSSPFDNEPVYEIKIFNILRAQGWIYCGSHSHTPSRTTHIFSLNE
jgi:hypothetical protein